MRRPTADVIIKADAGRLVITAKGHLDEVQELRRGGTKITGEEVGCTRTAQAKAVGGPCLACYEIRQRAICTASSLSQSRAARRRLCCWRASCWGRVLSPRSARSWVSGNEPCIESSSVAAVQGGCSLTCRAAGTTVLLLNLLFAFCFPATDRGEHDATICHEAHDQGLSDAVSRACVLRAAHHAQHGASLLPAPIRIIPGAQPTKFGKPGHGTALRY